MAYIDQQKKQKIAAAIKALKLPSSWRVSLSVSHHSSLNINIIRAPMTVLDDYIPSQYQLEHNADFEPKADNLYINEHRIDGTFRGKTLRVLQDIMDAVKTAGDWFDRSDSQSDCFNVAFWIHMGFGSTNRDCELVGRRRPTVSDTIAQVRDQLTTQPEFEANVVELFKPVPTFDPSLAEKLAIARAEMIRRYKVAFAATPVGATLNEYSLSVLADAAIQVTVD